MIARGFKSVLWVGAVGGAALGCYMVSLRVATERADLAKVDRQIVEAKRDIRSLKTELGTRGRLAQLEDWNANVLALSAPSSGQFVKDGYALARLQTNEPTVEQRTSEVRMASLETAPAAPAASADAAVKPQASAVPQKEAKPAQAASALVPRIVQAVAPAQRAPALVRRASYTPAPADAPSVRPATKPAKPARIADADRDSPAAAKPAPARKVQVAAKPAKPAAPLARDPRPAPRVAAAASADKPHPKAAKPAHGTAKLAGADAALRPAGSGHRGGAQ